MLTSVETPKFDFVLFYVANLDKALAHYEQMGFVRVEDGDGPGFRQLKGAQEMPQFGLLEVKEGMPPAGSMEIYYRVSDLQAHHQHLSEQGANPTAIEPRPFGNIFRVPNEDGFQTYMLG